MNVQQFFRRIHDLHLILKLLIRQFHLKMRSSDIFIVSGTKENTLTKQRKMLLSKMGWVEEEHFSPNLKYFHETVKGAFGNICICVQEKYTSKLLSICVWLVRVT